MIILRWVFLLLMLPVMTVAQYKQDYRPPVFTDNNRIEKIKATQPVVESLIKALAEKNHFPGYSYGVVVDGKLLYSGAEGYADVAQKTPATTSTMFRIASMSKSFTAMSILKLRDEGKLRLDDPAYMYIPEMKDQQLTADAPVISIRNLLSHSAGFPEDNPWGDRHLADTETQLLQLVKKGISFSNTASLNYEYSNLAFVMLGYIIHKVSGEYYADYIRKNIWEPLGIHAEWEYSKIPAPALAHGYRWLNDNWREEALLHDGIGGSMGGMIANVETFSKYVAFHLQAWPPRNEKEYGPVKRSTLREMHQPWTFNTYDPGKKMPDGRTCGSVTAYCFGLRYEKYCDGTVYIGHSGGLPGFGSNWAILPEYGIGVMLFANVTYAPAADINVSVIDTILRMADLKPGQLPPSNILTQRRNEIVKLLPDYANAKSSGIFAENFFEDYFVDSLKKEAHQVFAEAGAIRQVGEVVPENQLRGYFIVACEKGDVQISFTLTPEAVPLVQEYKLTRVR